VDGRKIDAGDAPATAGGCAVGCAVALAGLVVGFVVGTAASNLIGDAWTYCYDVAWPVAYDMADSPRFFIFEGLGWLLLYSLCLPVGFWLARRLLRGRRWLLRLGAWLLASSVLLAGVFTTDLMLNVSARDGMYQQARCPHGRPPWWPGWLPARGASNPCGSGPCLGAGR
jgi:hypothetical protein